MQSECSLFADSADFCQIFHRFNIMEQCHFFRRPRCEWINSLWLVNNAWKSLLHFSSFFTPCRIWASKVAQALECISSGNLFMQFNEGDNIAALPATKAVEHVTPVLVLD